VVERGRPDDLVDHGEHFRRLFGLHAKAR